MKKILVACSIMILSFFTVGCEKVIDLTEDESRMVAEYAAELLLKYDRNIELKYYDDKEAATEEITEAADVTTEDATVTGSTEDVTENSTEDISDEYIDETDTAISSSEFDLAEFAGISNLNIKYSHYMLLDSYPSYDKDGVYIEIEAPEGYKLLVLKFGVENVLNESQYIDLYDMDISYNIIVNDKRSAKQMLTILLDDLYTYQKNIEASMREEAVIIFQISDSVAETIENLKLKVKCDDKVQVVVLEE